MMTRPLTTKTACELLAKEYDRDTPLSLRIHIFLGLRRRRLIARLGANKRPIVQPRKKRAVLGLNVHIWQEYRVAKRQEKNVDYPARRQKAMPFLSALKQDRERRKENRQAKKKHELQRLQLKKYQASLKKFSCRGEEKPEGYDYFSGLLLVRQPTPDELRDGESKPQELPPDISDEEKKEARREHEESGLGFCTVCDEHNHRNKDFVLDAVHIGPWGYECRIAKILTDARKETRDRVQRSRDALLVAQSRDEQKGKRGRPRKHASDAARKRADRQKTSLNGRSPKGRNIQLPSMSRGEFLTGAPQGCGRPLNIGDQVIVQDGDVFQLLRYRNEDKP